MLPTFQNYSLHTLLWRALRAGLKCQHIFGFCVTFLDRTQTMPIHEQNQKIVFKYLKFTTTKKPVFGGEGLNPIQRFWGSFVLALYSIWHRVLRGWNPIPTYEEVISMPYTWESYLMGAKNRGGGSRPLLDNVQKDVSFFGWLPLP